MPGRFEGRTVIVTGAASGIGLACATRFAAEGARVCIADLILEKAAQAAQALPGGAFGLACDVASEGAVDACVDETVKRTGALHVVVNNAGLMTFKTIPDTSLEDWRRVLGVDLLGAVNFTRAAFRAMRREGDGPAGAIVNVASVHAVMTSPLVAPYAAAKAALLAFTRSTAIEGRAVGIRANAILPGAVDTPMLWSNPNLQSGVEKVDRTMVGRPENLAAAVAFLASGDAAFVNGASLLVDGGRLAQL